MNIFRADDFFKAIRGIDLANFATRKTDYEKLVEILSRQHLLPEEFDADEFFYTEIVSAQQERAKQSQIRLALERSGLNLEDGQINKLVEEISDRLPYSPFGPTTPRRNEQEENCDCGC